MYFYYLDTLLHIACLIISEFDCPDNSTYSVLTNLNQASCENPDGVFPLDFTSGEGCVCDDGLVFEDDECVEEVECGCSLSLANPAYLPVRKQLCDCYSLHTLVKYFKMMVITCYLLLLLLLLLERSFILE